MIPLAVSLVDTLAILSASILVGPPTLHWPEALACAPRGGFWVADRGPARVHLFASDGTPAASFGGSGQDEVEFIDRVSLTDPGGQFVYAADTEGSRVVKLTRTGVAVREIRMPADALSWPWRPRAMTSLPDGRVFIVDENSGVLAVTDPFDGLKWLAGDPRELASAPLRPSGLACRGGVLVISEQDTGVLWLLDLHGNPLSRVVVGGSPGSVDIRADGLGAVVDQDARVVRIFNDSAVLGVIPTRVGSVEITEPTAVCFTADQALLIADRVHSHVVRVLIAEVG